MVSRKLGVTRFLKWMGSILLTLVVVKGAGAADTLDLSKALKIGSGKTPVIEFTDPDCPFCRKAYQYFLTRSDVTLYIFFNPLPNHEHARAKAQYILSAEDQERAYAEVMSGVFDVTPPAGGTDTGKKLLEEQVAIAKKVGINEAPIFMIYGRVVRGFDARKIEELLPRN